MPRPLTAIGTFGDVKLDELAPGKWRARTRYRFEDGRLRQVERLGRSGPDAKRALLGALRTIDVDRAPDIRPTTRVRDLLEEFLGSKARMAPRTIDAYRRTARDIIAPAIGALPLSDATPRRLDRFLARVTEERGPSTAKMARSVLSGAFAIAVRADVLGRNPVREVGPISVPRGGSSAIPAEQLPALLAAVRADERLRALDLVDLTEFIAATGARIGEACALDWASIDAAAGLVTIRANVVRQAGSGLVVQAHTKTDAGTRTVPVPASLIALLEQRRQSHGGPVVGLVFPTRSGTPRDPSDAAADWREVRARLGVPGATWHSFRKTVATALDAAGLSARDVADYLGHAQPSMTLNVYMARHAGGSRAAAALEALVGPIESAE